MRRVIFFFFALLLLHLPAALQALPSYITFPSNIEWVTKDSDHFSALYRKGNEELANQGLRAAEKAYRLLIPILPQAPERTWIVFSDFHDSLNGYALPFPYPHIVVFVAPPDSDENLAGLESWLETVILHEYTHILHLYPAEGFWKVLRAVFGSWVAPNGLMPMHFHEGLAVLVETEKTKGGRGRGAYFSMLRRSAVEAKVWGTTDFFSLDQMDGATSRYPHGTSAYFFGYHLYKELQKRKGEKGIGDLIYEYAGAFPYFLNTQLEDIYQTDYPSLWNDAFDAGRQEALKEIKEIQSQPLNTLHWITESRFGKSDLTLSPDGKWAAYRRWTPTDGAAINVLDWEHKKIVRALDDVGGDTQGLCWMAVDKKPYLLYVDTRVSFNHLIKVVKAYDWESRKTQTLGLDHIHRLGCHSASGTLAVYQEVGGRGTVSEHKLTGGSEELKLKKEKEWAIPRGDWVTALLPTGDTTWIGMRTDAGTIQTSFLKWSDKDKTPDTLFSLPGHFYGFRAGNSAQEIYAVADTDKREEIWELDLGKKTSQKVVALVSGTNAFDRAGNRFLVSAYRHGGYDIALTELSTKAAVRKLPAGRKARAIAEEAVAPAKEEKAEGKAEASISTERSYSAFRTLVPRTWIPSLLFVPDGVQFGIWVPGFDISQRHLYNITAGYDTRGLPFGDVNYTHRFGDSYNVTGDLFFYPSYVQLTDSFLKRWGASLNIGGVFGPIPPSITFGVVFKRLEATPGVVNSNQSVGLQLGLSYNFALKRRPLSISPIKGTNLSLTHNQFIRAMGSSDDYFSTTFSADQYFENPFIREHVFYFGLRAGLTEGTFLFNSYFEGGGEILFSQARGVFLNRGFLPGLFLSRRIANLNVEYRFPITNVERGIKLLPIRLKNIHAALTFDTTTFDFGPQSSAPQDLGRIYYPSVGGELRSEWNFGFYLPAQLRAGLYHGFGPFGEDLYLTFGIEASL